MRGRLGRKASQHAWEHFTRLILRDGHFLEVRTRVLEEYPWITSIDIAVAEQIFEPLLKALAAEKLRAANVLAMAGFGSDLLSVADLMQVLAELGEYYCFDQIPDASTSRFMLEMLQTGDTPHTSGSVGPSMFVWQPRLVMLPGDLRKDFLDRTRTSANAFWNRAVELERSEKWGANLYARDLERNVGWFFDWKIKGQTIRQIALDHEAVEYTVSDAVRNVGALLGIPRQTGRPKKKERRKNF